VEKKILKAEKNGIINLHDLKKQITPKTALISISAAASDIGTIQPLSEVAEIIREERQDRLKSGDRTPIWLHTDASQGFEVLEMNVARFGVDMMTINSGKMHGPKGVGALFVKPASGIRLRTLTHGGGQEKGVRSGTENVAGTIGFTTSAEYLAKHRKKSYKELSDFKEKLKTALLNEFEDKIIFIGSAKKQLVSFLPVVFKGYDAERMIFILEEYGVLTSTGAACAANKGEKSESLKAIGLTDDEIAGSLRLSFSTENSLVDIPDIIKAFKQAVSKNNRLV
jgi:cysteine desulfurase